MIRGRVVTRKNARGSHNGDAARNAAVIWTVTATAQMARLNVLTYLAAYLSECGRNSGKPLSGPALERFLPWNAAPKTSAHGHSRRPTDKPRANNTTIGVGHSEPPRRPSTLPSHRTSEIWSVSRISNRCTSSLTHARANPTGCLIDLRFLVYTGSKPDIS
jgi:hypothetical protein